MTAGRATGTVGAMRKLLLGLSIIVSAMGFLASCSTPGTGEPFANGDDVAVDVAGEEERVSAVYLPSLGM